MVNVKLKVSNITKIKEFEDSVVVYTKNEFWVCEKEQKIPTKDDVFISLQLKQKV